MSDPDELEHTATDQSAMTMVDIDARIVFHDDDQIMEVNCAFLRLSESAEVNRFYDRIEERITQTGENLWFFLINYFELRIDEKAWFAFSKRGADLREAHGMGSVRFDASDMTRRQVERDIGTEAFDPNLFLDRQSALKRLQTLPSQRRQKPAVLVPNFVLKDWNWRLEFDQREQILHINFSDFSFEHSRDVNDVHDFIESQVRPTERKWYFLINYAGTRIQSPAWLQYSARGQALNEAYSLGSVRYAPGSETATDIRLRAQEHGVRPNIRNTYEEAYQLILDMQSAQSSEAYRRPTS